MAAKKRATKKRATKKAASKKPAAKKRPAAKKAASKKRASKKKATSKKKAAPAKKSAKVKVGAKPPTKTEILNHIADDTELSRKEVAAVVESMTNLMAANLSSDHGIRMVALKAFKDQVKVKKSTAAKKKK